MGGIRGARYDTASHPPECRTCGNMYCAKAAGLAPFELWCRVPVENSSTTPSVVRLERAPRRGCARSSHLLRNGAKIFSPFRACGITPGLQGAVCSLDRVHRVLRSARRDRANDCLRGWIHDVHSAVADWPHPAAVNETLPLRDYHADCCKVRRAGARVLPPPGDAASCSPPVRTRSWLPVSMCAGRGRVLELGKMVRASGLRSCAFCPPQMPARHCQWLLNAQNPRHFQESNAGAS